MQPLVSIITVNFNQPTLTGELIESIRRNSYKNVEIYVVDNASKESPAAYFADRYPEVCYIESKENLGFAGGNNLAVARAKGDYLFFINNDAEMTDGCIEKLLEAFVVHASIGIVSPLLCYFDQKGADGRPDLIQYAGATLVHPATGRNQIIGEKELDSSQFDRLQPTGYAHGAAMMVPRSVLEKVGPMFEGFFLYYEELDWCAAIRRAGYEIFIEPRARIYHKESATVGAMSPLKTYYINRNRILFMRRNASPGGLALFIIFFLGVALPKNTVIFVAKRKPGHLKAFYRAIDWNIRDAFASKGLEGPAARLASSSLS